LYREQYPARRHPTHTDLRNYFQCVRQEQLVRSRTQRGSSERVRLRVLTAVDPNSSVREISRIHGIPRSIASPILRNSRFHPYCISLIHELTANNFALTSNSTQVLLTELNETLHTSRTLKNIRQVFFVPAITHF